MWGGGEKFIINEIWVGRGGGGGAWPPPSSVYVLEGTLELEYS